jgi:hypothetical protein
VRPETRRPQYGDAGPTPGGLRWPVEGNYSAVGRRGVYARTANSRPSALSETRRLRRGKVPGSAASIRIPEYWQATNGLTFGIDRVAASARVLAPMRNEAPA